MHWIFPEAGFGLPCRVGDYELRWLAVRDLPRVAALEAAVFLEPLALSALLAKALDRGTCYLGAWRNNELAAYFGFEISGPTAHVISNVTHPGHRRRGLAAKVLEAAVPCAQARGAHWFLGEVRVSNQAQLRVLQRIGWRAVGTVPRFFGNGEAAIVVWYGFDA